MSHHKKKFTFDDPEDSYWNESGSNSSSLFDDLPSKQWAARAAVDNLFDAKDELRSTPIKGPPVIAVNPASGDSAPKLAGASPQVRNRLVDEFINTRTAALKLEEANEGIPVSHGAPSVISECSVSSLPSDAHRLDLDYNRLRAEHRKLQRHLETVRHDRFRALDVKETVRRMLRGDPVSLDFYQSKSEKLQLLDAAIDVVDCNVIQTVVLFLKQTLCDSIFREMLLKRPEAAEEYMAHLKTRKLHDELTLTLFALGRLSEAAMVEFSASTRHKIPDQKIAALKKCTVSAFSDPQLSSEATIVNEYINLLERQISIERADSHSNSDIFKRFPKNVSLVGRSAVATLYYSCLYHYDLPQNSLASPHNIRDSLRISEKEFIWTATSALVRQSRWPDIERILQPKSLMGVLQNRGLLNTTKLSCPFSWESLFFILHTNTVQPPKDLSGRLLRNVPDQELRLKLAEKYDITEIVIEALVGQRDRMALSRYCAKLTPHTPEAYKALAALNNTGIKWKN